MPKPIADWGPAHVWQSRRPSHRSVRARIDRPQSRRGPRWIIGLAKFFAGRNEETEAHIREALRISPQDRLASSWMNHVEAAKLETGRDEEQPSGSRGRSSWNPNWPVPQFWLAAALARLGRLEAARSRAEQDWNLTPLSRSRSRSSAFSDHPFYLAGRERVYEGMRLAGVPEG